MSESVFLQILKVLLLAFPPFESLLARWLPDKDNEPLVGRIRELLPAESASAEARKSLEETTSPGNVHTP